MAASTNSGFSSQWVGNVMAEVFGCCDGSVGPEAFDCVSQTSAVPYASQMQSGAPAAGSVADATTAKRPPPQQPPQPQMPSQSIPAQHSMTGRNASVSAKGSTASRAAKELSYELKSMKSLDEHRALLYADWCCYLCCCGCGTSSVSSAPGVECKCCLCWSRCRSDQDTSTDGCCSLLHSCCCCLCGLQFPRRVGQPWCKVCNVECCTASRVTADIRLKAAGRGNHDATKLYRHDTLQDFFVPCHIWCCGLACLPTIEYCANRMTCGGCDSVCENMLPWCNDESLFFGWCGYYFFCWKLYAQLKLPFLCKEVPILACCGRKCRQRAGHRAVQA